ncbi:MAG: HAD family phosphatase [Solobacterium sp.]|nr:HAD family phosphatase [Solobacterium sp.]
MIDTILFDCDGLMFDTERLSQQLWREEAERNGCIIPGNFFDLITGANAEEAQYLIEQDPLLKKTADVIRDKRFDLDYWRSFEKDSISKKGLKELFRFLDENHYRKGICSSSGRAYVETLIGTVSDGLNYDVIVCGDMVTKTKPDPEIFLKAAEAVGADPGSCLVLEDSKNGILAAANAKMHSVFIRDTIEPDDEMAAAIEFECRDLLEVISLLKKI